jgi:O-Antigen ligase
MAGAATTLTPFAPLRRAPRWPWLVPVGVFLAVGMSPVVGLPLLFAAVTAVAAVVVLSRHPGPTLVALVVFLPLQIPVFSFLYRNGVPGGLLRPLGSIKEVLALAVIVAAGREVISRRSKLDRLDKLLLGYVGALLLYLLVPGLVSEGSVTLAFTDRLLGFRLNGGFLLLFVAARHAPIDARWRQRFVAAILTMAGVLAAIGVYQFLQPARFSDFVVNDLGIPIFQFEVMETPVAEVVQLVRWTTASPVRVGSLFVGPFDFADFLILPAAILFDRLTRRDGRPRDVLLLALIGAAMLASQTRANVIGLAVVALLALSPGPRRILANRLRLVAIVVLAIVAFIPSLVSSRLGGAENSAASTEQHFDEIRGGFEILMDNPLGLGVGTAPALAVRLEGAPVVISDNSILQVGNELGVVMMVFFVVVLVAVVLRLGRADREGPENRLARSAWLALIGLILAGQFHHVFQVFSVTWPLWALAGLALRDPPQPRPGSDPQERQTAAPLAARW